MNEFSQINEMYARDIMLRRQQTSARSGGQPVQRRTTRRAFASGLRRMADRLDG